MDVIGYILLVLNGIIAATWTYCNKIDKEAGDAENSMTKELTDILKDFGASFQGDKDLVEGEKSIIRFRQFLLAFSKDTWLLYRAQSQRVFRLFSIIAVFVLALISIVVAEIYVPENAPYRIALVIPVPLASLIIQAVVLERTYKAFASIRKLSSDYINRRY